MCAAVFDFHILIAMGTFLETDIFVCIWDTKEYPKFEATGINHTSYPIIMVKIKQFLPVVTEILVETHTQMHVYTRSMLDSPQV